MSDISTVVRFSLESSGSRTHSSLPVKYVFFIFNWFLKRSVQEASFRVQPFQKPFDVSDLRKSLELAADYCMETLLQDIKLSCNTSSASAALFPKSGGRDWTLRIVIIFHAFMFMWEVVISRRQRVRTIAGHRCLPRKTKHRFSLNHFVFSQSPSAWQHGLSRAKLVYGGVQKLAKQYCSFVWLFWHTVAPAGAERLSCLGRSRFAVMLPAHFLLRACLCFRWRTAWHWYLQLQNWISTSRGGWTSWAVCVALSVLGDCRGSWISTGDIMLFGDRDRGHCSGTFL